MTLSRIVIYPCLALVAACGTSRSTRNSLCSNVKAVVDPNIAPPVVDKNYDPSAALLLFKATSDKLSLESRCNARLVNKLNVKHLKTDGTLEEASAPIQFDKLKLQLETGENNLELHTSAHCFFRVWDSRSENQLKNNPAIGIEPVRSMLQNLNTRYQLYKSMLTTPQQLVVFAKDGTPVTFSYTLQTTPIYESFFAEVEKKKSRAFEAVVGRELSKSSVLLDELVLHECRADEKNIRRLLDDEVRAAVTNESSFITYLQKNSNNKVLQDVVRSRAFTSGRHELCFSQTDMVVAPIRLSGAVSAQQQAVLESISQAQTADIDRFDAVTQNKTADAFIAKIESGKAVVTQATPAGLTACEHTTAYPGYSVANLFAQSLEKKYYPRWNFDTINRSQFHTLFDSVFPKFSPTPFSGAEFGNALTQSVRSSICLLIGKNHDSSGNCTTVDDELIGSCPSSTTFLERNHAYIAKSLHIASTSPLHMLRRMRDESPLALTLPLVALRDFIDSGCDSQNNCSSEATQLKDVFSVLDLQNVTTASGKQLAPTVAQDGFSITKYDEDHQFQCTFTPRNNRDQSNLAFQAFAKDSEQILAQGVNDGQSTTSFRHRFGARFLYLKCVAAGYQRMYNTADTVHGLVQNLKFLDVSFVQSAVPANSGKHQLSNSEIITSGVPQKFPFARLFFKDSVINESPPELAARLLAGPHVRINFCDAGRSAADNGNGLGDLSFCKADINPSLDLKNFESELQNVPAHITFLTQLPNWLPERDRSKYGSIIYPADNFSADSARYFFTAGDSGTTISAFGLFPVMMLSTVQD
ncbi:MAG: hypothetical protein RL189_3173, partial [Pseudomonadota bacterium]